MKIGLLGCSALPSPTQQLTNFAQLRGWSLLKFLKQHEFDVRHFLLSDHNQHGWNVYDEQTILAIQTFCSDLDVVITAGPFLPALVLDAIPSTIPLWLDWPSDPLADLHAKKNVSTVSSTDQSVVQEMVHFALRRADAIGVISERQYWATLGQLLLLGAEDTPMSSIPIAYDFPFSPPQRSYSSEDVLITGSMNTWLNLERLVSDLATHHDQTIHITGGAVDHFPEGESIIQDLLSRFPQLQYHGWLEEAELQKVIGQCRFSTWLDSDGIEPLLGSRTRALFAIWNGLQIFGSSTTELATFLVQHSAMLEWNGGADPTLLQRASQINISEAQALCRRSFSPEQSYAPLINWLKNPVRRSKNTPESIVTENRRLRREIQSIYQSKTWRLTNRIHKFFS